MEVGVDVPDVDEDGVPILDRGIALFTSTWKTRLIFEIIFSVKDRLNSNPHRFSVDNVLFFRTNTNGTIFQFKNDETKASGFMSLAIEHNFSMNHFAISLEI